LQISSRRQKEFIMSKLFERKVGIVSCSGEELPEGTVARLAALKVLNELRPKDTVTICLPLFLAGGAGDRAFAKLHPTITVDGCDLRCAARATEKYSNKPAASIVVNDLVSAVRLEKPEGRRRLNAAGHDAVKLTAERMAALVDQSLGKANQPHEPDQASVPVEESDKREATCSCGSGVAVTKVTIGRQSVELIALPLIFRHFRQERLAAGGPSASLDEQTAHNVFEAVKIYNSVPAELESAYREAALREYAVFCAKEKP
jgi:uncharacterized metal-binding protein